ncbi:MAG: hypothetical protein AB8G26_13555 [Ilumatobacter sp.]
MNEGALDEPDAVGRSVGGVIITVARAVAVVFVVGLALAALVRATDSPDTDIVRFALGFTVAVAIVAGAARLGFTIAAWLMRRGVLFHVVGAGLVLGGLTLAVIIPIVGNRDTDDLSTGDIAAYVALGVPIVVLGVAMVIAARRR